MCELDEDVDAGVQARGDMSADPSGVSRRIASARGSRAHLQRGIGRVRAAAHGYWHGQSAVQDVPWGHSRPSKRGDSKPSGADAPLQRAYARLQARNEHPRTIRRPRP
jgi:hypothetical protein